MRVASQVREVVEYAAQRFITVVPEIELPGHCRAALACYTHLSCAPPRLQLLVAAVSSGAPASAHPHPMVPWSAHVKHLCMLPRASPEACILRSVELRSQADQLDRHLGWRCAGLDDAQMETVPTRWGVHADVYCAACALRPVGGCLSACVGSRTYKCIGCVASLSEKQVPAAELDRPKP